MTAEPTETVPDASRELLPLIPPPGDDVEPGEDTTSRTWFPNRMSALLRAKYRAAYPLDPAAPPRPTAYGECHDRSLGTSDAPCPYVSCVHHLYLEVTEAGSVKFNFPHLEPHELQETCSVRVADQGGHSLDQVGVLANMTRERVRQIEGGALTALRRVDAVRALEADLEPDVPEMLVRARTKTRHRITPDPHVPTPPAQLPADVVAETALTAHGQRFFCRPYHAVIAARACLRSQVLVKRTDASAYGGVGGSLTRSARLECLTCAQGQTVVARLAGVADTVSPRPATTGTLGSKGPRARVAAACRPSEPWRPTPAMKPRTQSAADVAVPVAVVTRTPVVAPALVSQEVIVSNLRPVQKRAYATNPCRNVAVCGGHAMRADKRRPKALRDLCRACVNQAGARPAAPSHEVRPPAPPPPGAERPAPPASAPVTDTTLAVAPTAPAAPRAIRLVAEFPDGTRIAVDDLFARVDAVRQALRSVAPPETP